MPMATKTRIKKTIGSLVGVCEDRDEAYSNPKPTGAIGGLARYRFIVMTVEDQQLNKAQRFVRIVELLQNPGGVTAANLMGRFDLDDRTLRRYLADLKALGLPINDKGRGPSRQLWLDPKYQRRGVRVDLLELVSLHFGRTQFDFLEGTGFASDLEQSLETLSNLAVGVGPDVIRHMDRKFMAVPENRKDHSGQADLLDDVLTALLYQNPSRAH